MEQKVHWLGLHMIDWAVLIAYFVIVVGIGVWSYKKVKDMSDFFMGGRRFGKIFMMFFAFGAGTSSQQAVGVVAGTWRAGLAGIWWQFLWLWATPFYWIVAPVLRRMRALTTADFFEARYSTSTATLYSLYGIIISIVYIAVGLYGSGKMVNALTGEELDRVAEQWAISVPEVKWNTEENRVGRGILFEVPPAAAQELESGNLSDEVRTKFDERKKRLPQEVDVNVVESGERWNIVDGRLGYVYPVRKVTDVSEEGERTQSLRVYTAGWRLLEGFELAILAMTVMFVIYGMAGGLGAAIITDFLQGILTIAFSFMLLPFVFAKVGGFGHLHDQGEIKHGMFDLVASADVAEILGQEPITVFYVFMLSLTALCGIVVQPHIMGVCGAGKTEFEGRFGFTMGNFLKRFCTIAWTFTGLACIVWYLGADSPMKTSPDPETRQTYEALMLRASPEFHELPEAEQARIEEIGKDFADQLFGQAAYDILPAIAPGLVGLLLASLLAAMMSSADAQMVVSSGLFTENIYRRFLIKGRSHHHYLWVGRVAGLLIVALALILQSTFTDIIDALRVVIKTPAAIGISLWIGIVWRGWTPIAVWISTLVAAGTWAFAAFYPEVLHANVPALHFMFNSEGQMFDAWQMLSYLTAGVLSGLLISAITPRTPREKLDNFFDLLHTPVRPGEKVETPCTLPEDPLPKGEKVFNYEDIEIPKPSRVGFGGFVAAWIMVGLVVWLTWWLAQAA